MGKTDLDRRKRRGGAALELGARAGVRGVGDRFRSQHAGNRANGYDYREKGSFIYVYTTKEIQEMEQAQRVKKTEVFRLFYTPAANAKTLLMPVLSARTTWASRGVSPRS